MEEKKRDWGRVNSIMKGDNKIAVQEDINRSVSITKEMVKEPDGIIAKYKARAIERKAGVEFLKAWYESQLEVAKHQLKTAVQLKKKESDLEAERFIMDLNRRHLNYLKELEFYNLGERIEAMEKLGDTIAQSMQKISSKDWPQKMIDDTIQGVIDLNKRFFEKIMIE